MILPQSAIISTMRGRKILQEFSKVNHGKYLTNLTKFGKKKVDGCHSSNFKGYNDMPGQPKLVAREGLEG